MRWRTKQPCGVVNKASINAFWVKVRFRITLYTFFSLWSGSILIIFLRNVLVVDVAGTSPNVPWFWATIVLIRKTKKTSANNTFWGSRKNAEEKLHGMYQSYDCFLWDFLKTVRTWLDKSNSPGFHVFFRGTVVRKLPSSPISANVWCISLFSFYLGENFPYADVNFCLCVSRIGFWVDLKFWLQSATFFAELKDEAVDRMKVLFDSKLLLTENALTAYVEFIVSMFCVIYNFYISWIKCVSCWNTINYQIVRAHPCSKEKLFKRAAKIVNERTRFSPKGFLKNCFLIVLGTQNFTLPLHSRALNQFKFSF